MNPTARIEADFCVENDRTRLARLTCAAPLKIAKTFALNNGGVGLCTMDASPGLLAGDRYELTWRLDKGAYVEIATQGFTRVHPSRDRPCKLTTRFELAAGAVCEWFPEPLVLYHDAELRSATEVSLSPGATFLAGEIWCAGRIARDERFAFGAFQNRYWVRRSGEIIYANALHLRPAQWQPRIMGIMTKWTHSGNFFLFCETAGEEIKEVFCDILESQAGVYGGVSLLHRNGVIVSLVGHRAHDLQETILKLRAEAHKYLSPITLNGNDDLLRDVTHS